ncbi:hypothetical protein AB0F10_44195, partial [Actinoplanes sp. NPDC026623]
PPAEAARRAADARQAEAERQLRAAQEAEAARQAAEEARQAEATRLAQAAREAEAARLAGGDSSDGGINPVSGVPMATRPGPNPAAFAVPIGRLMTSGPTAPPRYADADLGATWFTAKPGTGTEPGTPTAAEPGIEPAGQDEEGNDESGGVVLDLDITGLVGGPAGAPADPEPEPASGPRTPPAAEEPDEARLVPDPAPAEVRPAATDGTGPLGPEDLAAIRWRLDGATLREVVDDRDALRVLGERLDGPLSEERDNVAKAGLLSVRAEVYRLLEELGMAAAASRLALAHAESSGDVQAMVIAQAELAHVLRLRGDHMEADRLFERAASAEAPELLRSVVHENAGRSCFDQGRHMEALDHFARAVRLGLPGDQELAQRIDVALEAVYIHVLRDGWGPYPRSRREILGLVKDAEQEQS